VPAAPDYAPSLAASGRRRPPQQATPKNSRLGFFGTPSGRTSSRRHLPHGTALGYRGCGYKTASGRPKWLNRDPAGIAGGINLYGYVANNPISWVDFLGLTLTNDQIANIIFNETRSLSGGNIEKGRTDMAQAIINGDEAQDAGKGRRPATAPTTAKIPPAEQKTSKVCKAAVNEARAQREKGIDPTNGAMHFNLRPDDSTAPFQGNPIRTHDGPFNNSYPTSALPNSTGVYINTYK